jgi:hypothetical protein
MSKLYVLGGKQRKLLVRTEEEWNQYETAVVLSIDTETGAVAKCLEFETPLEAKPHERSSVSFKGGTLIGDKLYTCTSTEALTLQLPELRVINYVSLPCFNDLHHLTPCHDNTLLAVVTGLDMVVRFTPQGEVLEEWDVLGDTPWQRFSPSVDYRKVDTTKPHQSHPNFVFELDDEVWVTRMFQRDAVCLTNRRKRIDISVESPHDGLVRFGKAYFTLVDGRVVIADTNSLQVEKIIDLKPMEESNSLLGWCRGLLPVTSSRLWVGFSRVRKTSLQENVQWIKKILKEGMTEEPTHVSLYDLESSRCVQRFDVEPYGLDTVFSILSGV